MTSFKYLFCRWILFQVSFEMNNFVNFVCFRFRTKRIACVFRIHFLQIEIFVAIFFILVSLTATVRDKMEFKLMKGKWFKIAMCIESHLDSALCAVLKIGLSSVSHKIRVRIKFEQWIIPWVPLKIVRGGQFFDIYSESGGKFTGPGIWEK